MENKGSPLRVVWSGDSKNYPQNRFLGGLRDSYIIHFVRSGSGFLEVNGQTHRIYAGESFIIYPNTYVKYYPTQEDPWEYTWVNFVGMQVKDILSGISFSKKSPVLPKAEESPEKIFLDIDRVFKNSQIDIDSRSLETVGLLCMLFSYYTRHYPTQRNQPEHSSFKKSREIIDQNLNRNDFNVSSLALELGLSRATLFRLFKKHSDKSPIEYINELKISRACRFLTQTDLPIKAIANSLGFNNPLYFSRFFRKNMNVSPTQFRENKKMTVV